MTQFKIAILIVFLFGCSRLFAQGHEHHLNFPYEVGVSNGIVYSFSEEEFAYGLHAHAIKNFGISKKVGVGIGYEAIFGDHKHDAFSILLHYMLTDHFSVNLAPGLIFLESQPNQSRFALHTEALYEFEIGAFHIGPLIGVSINSEDYHASLGLHMALGF